MEDAIYNPTGVIFFFLENVQKPFILPLSTSSCCVFYSYPGSGAHRHTLSVRIQPHYLIDALIKLIQFIDRFTIVLLYDDNIGKYFTICIDKGC